MFDTMTLTKTAGALCGALLVFMLGGWVAQEIYGSGYRSDGQAYVIEVDEPDSAVEEVEEVDFASLYMDADPSKGERVFNKCSACHKLEAGANGVGPYLHGVVGREVDSAEGFNYSGALEQVVSVWTPEELDAFLESPRNYAPGTSMGFAGLSSAEERLNVIAYMDMSDGEMTTVGAAGGQEEASMDAEAEVEPASDATEDAAKEAATEEAVEEATTDEAVEEAATDEAVEEAATDEAAEEATTEDVATDEAANEDAATDETTETAMLAEDEAEQEGASEEASAEDSTEAASGFEALVAAADLSLGERVYNQCKACHVLEAGNNRVGPYLHDVVGREIGAAEGFRYSNAFEALDGVWTYDELSAFLENPRDYARGNRMSFRGLSDEQERAAVIAYIEAESQ